MKIKLSVKERIIIPLLIKESTKQGNVIEMLSVYHIIDKVSLTEQEISDWNVSGDDNGNVKWDSSKVQDKEFDLTKEQYDILTKAAKYFDENSLVNLDNVFIIQKLLKLEFKNE